MNWRKWCKVIFVGLYGVFSLIFEAGAVSWESIAVADAFVATGSASNPQGADLTANNYGGAGALGVAPASATKGEFQTLLRFDLAGAASIFDSAYGSGAWQITAIQLTLGSNFGVQGVQPNNNIFNAVDGGGFLIQWLADDSWTEGTGSPSSPGASGVNYDSLGNLLMGTHEQVGTYTYAPPGKDVPVVWSLGLTSGFLVDASALGEVSLLLSAAETGGASYLFNSRSFNSNHPTITVTAVPEPSATVLVLAALGILGGASRRGRS